MPVKLADLAVFAGAKAERLASLASRVEEKSLLAHQLVFRRGDRCDGLYVVAQGSVSIRTESPGQPIERVLDLGPGEVFGESEILDEAPRRFTARTLGDATLALIPLAPLRELLREQTTVETSLRMLAVRRQTARVRALLAPNSRHEQRIWVDRDVWITTGRRNESYRVRLIDLSNCGACISRAPADWTAGEELSFSLGTLENPGLLQVRGVVRWRRESAVGIAFEAAGPELRRKVEKTLRELVPV